MSKPIDSAHLEQYICGDDALRDEILTIFEEQAGAWIAKFDPALSDEDWQNAAHALKGASRGVGAWAVGDLCEEAESMTGDLPDKGKVRDKHLVSLKERLREAVDYARVLRDGE